MLCWLICFFISDLFRKHSSLGIVLFLFTSLTKPLLLLTTLSHFLLLCGFMFFIYLHRGEALQGMTQMFKNRRAWLVKGSHKPSRQCLPRFSSPFRFLLFSLLSDICLQELRDCSCDFYFFLCAGLVTVMHEPKNWIIFPWRKSARY